MIRGEGHPPSARATLPVLSRELGELRVSVVKVLGAHGLPRSRTAEDEEGAVRVRAVAEETPPGVRRGLDEEVRAEQAQDPGEPGEQKKCQNSACDHPCFSCQIFIKDMIL